jgi:lipoyl(octanoyl) transferase
VTVLRDRLDAGFSALADGSPVEWVIADGLTPYDAAVAEMEARAGAIAAGRASERVWLVEHPPLYTAGTSAQDDDLVLPTRFPVHRTGRGGQFTYHGPGQRVAYVMLDLSRRTPDLRRYVAALEAWLIATLQSFKRPRRAARGPGRGLGAPPRAGGGGRGQDRRHRHPRAPLGHFSRCQPERRARSHALRRHRALRHPPPTA